jgi:hypothetical protein
MPAGASVTLSCTAVSGATQYEFEIDFQNASGTFVDYYTYQGSSPSRTFWPQYKSGYRFRVRAQNAAGWGPNSDWATFSYR